MLAAKAIDGFWTTFADRLLTIRDDFFTGKAENSFFERFDAHELLHNLQNVSAACWF